MIDGSCPNRTAHGKGIWLCRWDSAECRYPADCRHLVRIRKSARHDTLLRNYIRTTGITVWKQWRYHFDFAAGMYTIDGKKLRLRSLEMVYLYERLVLYRRPKETICRYAIQRLRERYGSDFLAEIIAHGPSGGVEGKAKRSFFERVLREYLEKDGRMAYEKWGYYFDFLNGSYIWNGEELRVTPREAVFIYERAVLRLQDRRGIHRCTEGNILYLMRKKFGRRFLHEIFPNEETKNDFTAILRHQAEKSSGPFVAASTDTPKPDTL